MKREKIKVSGWKKSCFFLLVGTRIYGGLYERKEIYLFRGGGGRDLYDSPVISRRTHGRKRVTAQNLNDCHYCPTNYSRSIIQPLFRVGNKEREHRRRCTELWRYTPLFTEYTTARQKVFSYQLVAKWFFASFIVARYLSKRKEKRKLDIFASIQLCNTTWFILPFESIYKEKHLRLNNRIYQYTNL